MQIQRTFFSVFLVFLITIGIFSPLTFSFEISNVYDYGQFSKKINTSSEKILHKTLSFDSPRTSFSFVFPDYLPEDDEEIRVEWLHNGKKFIRFLDIEDEKDRSVISTFPFVTLPTDTMEVTLYFQKKVPESITLVTTSDRIIWKKLIFLPGNFVTHADGAPRVVTRSEWWADESLRYFSDASLEKKKADWVSRWKTPRLITETQAQHDVRIQENTEMSAINSLSPDTRNTVSIQRYEWVKKLIWSLEKVKKVEKIVIHHTAESLSQDADDASLVRAIYNYHTNTKGWWDIWYNYLIGQRWQIYEGRAGGDYVQWAHVYGNNAGTVGISVIGNYGILHLNRDQEKWLQDAVIWLAQKYGIDVSESSIAAKLCKSGENCKWKLINTPNLIGHRDIWVTDCPGSNIFIKIPELRTLVASRVWKVNPIYNYNTVPFDPIAPQDEVKYVIASSPVFIPPSQVSPVLETPSFSDSQTFVPAPSFWWKPIKIKLSYPKDTISITTATDKKPSAKIGLKISPFAPRDTAEISLLWKDKLSIRLGEKILTASTFSLSSDLVRISSWSRIPEWDTSKKYNDNLFRGKITVRNQNGKLLLINELPIEDYLRGMGEVSNGDLPEKIKTIVVAARSYATFYQSSQNRKFGTLLYDGSDNPDEFQKYLWYSYEMRSPNTSKFVLETKWETIKYAGKVVKAWYFSSSDGKTRSYLEYCQSNGGKKCEDIPYLRTVSDPAWVGKKRAGHGVGISGIGATYAAGLGKNYQDIIRYYMNGVSIWK